MALSQTKAVELATHLHAEWRTERTRLDTIDRWLRWENEPVPVPRQASNEHKMLAAMAKTPWLSLVVRSVTQGLFAKAYHTSLDQATTDSTMTADSGQALGTQSPPWQTWVANGFPRRQSSIYQATIGYGYSFVVVLPGKDMQNFDRSVMRPYSPRKAYAEYGDPGGDDWPLHGITVGTAADKKRRLVTLYDETHMYYVSVDNEGENPEFVSYQAHGAELCPMIRYGQPDLEGRCAGEVEPHINVAKRIAKTTYDRLLAQHFNSWKVRTATGLELDEDSDNATERNREKLRLRNEDFLISDSSETEFGTLDETSLDGFINSERFGIETLGGVSQTPTHALTGNVSNLSADALAATRAGLTQKTAEWQNALGSGHVQALQLAMQFEGQDSYAADMTARMNWQDMEIRSMSQAVDALGKATEMLGIPPQALWSRIPGVEQADVEEWKAMRSESDPLTAYAEQLRNQTAEV